jgi:hypothetical protein
MRAARMTMMTEEDIRTEFGWNEDMIYSLLQNPYSPNARRKKITGGYTYGLYRRERVLAVAPSKEGRLPNGDGMRRYGVIGRTQAGRHSAIWDACWASQRSLPAKYSSDLDTAPTACHRQRGSGWMRSAPVGRLQHA